jgi:hypothetical protein
MNKPFPPIFPFNFVANQRRGATTTRGLIFSNITSILLPQKAYNIKNIFLLKIGLLDLFLYLDQFCLLAGMFDTLDQVDPVTFLAPMNAAWEQVHPDFVDHLKKDIKLLRQVP